MGYSEQSSTNHSTRPTFNHGAARFNHGAALVSVFDNFSTRRTTLGIDYRPKRKTTSHDIVDAGEFEHESGDATLLEQVITLFFDCSRPQALVFLPLRLLPLASHTSSWLDPATEIHLVFDSPLYLPHLPARDSHLFDGSSPVRVHYSGSFQPQPPLVRTKRLVYCLHVVGPFYRLQLLRVKPTVLPVRLPYDWKEYPMMSNDHEPDPFAAEVAQYYLPDLLFHLHPLDLRQRLRWRLDLFTDHSCLRGSRVYYPELGIQHQVARAEQSNISRPFIRLPVQPYRANIATSQSGKYVTPFNDLDNFVSAWMR